MRFEKTNKVKIKMELQHSKVAVPLLFVIFALDITDSAE